MTNYQNITLFTNLDPMKIAKVAFGFQENKQQFSTLNKRVNAYFKDNNLRKTGNWELHLKTVIL